MPRWVLGKADGGNMHTNYVKEIDLILQILLKHVNDVIISKLKMTELMVLGFRKLEDRNTQSLVVGFFFFFSSAKGQPDLFFDQFNSVKL